MRHLVVCLALCAMAFGGTIVPELEQILASAQPDQKIDIVVKTALQADLNKLGPSATYDEKIEYLQRIAQEAQRGILAFLAQTDAANIRSFWLESKIALSATPDIIRALAAREDVEYVMDDFIVQLDDPVPSSEPDAPGWNISKVKADSCWAVGIDGTGVVVGNVDTGVEVSHPAFQGRWRSTNGWFDAVNGQASPYDDNGHGTHTMGTICGGDGLGPAVDDIGVAPGATFICAKAFNSSGSGQSSWISACLDWMAGTGRPQVISNSWGSGDRTTTAWFNAFNNLRSLGIVCVASIGNSGPNPNTSNPPGSYPIMIGVGSTTSTDAISSFSSRGPALNQSPWNETRYWPRSDWNLINPSIAAPGSGVRSATRGGGYTTMDGTSMACPHVAGAAALLLQKKPTLTHDEIFVLLTDWADRPSGGAPYPNNNYGWGRLNCKAALDRTGSATQPLLSLSRTRVINDGNGNGRLDPGENANLVAYLRNFSTVGATNVRGTLRTSDPYLVLTDSTANFGNIAGRDSANNSGDLFGLLVAGNCPEGRSVPFSLFLVCDETTFTTTFSLVVGQPPVQGELLMTHDTGYCKLTVSCQGSIGYDVPPGLDAGAGFCYPKTGASQLFYSSFAMGNSETYLADRFFSRPASGAPNQDLMPQESLRPVMPPANGADQHFRGSYSDAGHPAAKGIVVTQQSYQVASPGYDDFVVMTFDITNNGSSAVNGMYAGIIADFDIGTATANICSSDVSRRLAFMRPSTSANPSVGVKILSPTTGARTAAIDHARYVYPDSCMTDGQKWRFLNGTISQPNSNRAYDWSICVSSGPFNLSPGARQHFAIAFVGGTSGSEIRQNADSAQSWYDRNVGLAGPRTPAEAKEIVLAVKPNPFASQTGINYQLTKAGRVRISVLDAAGREVECLTDEARPAGQHKLLWNTRNVAPGVYFIRLETGEAGYRQKVVKF